MINATSQTDRYQLVRATRDHLFAPDPARRRKGYWVAFTGVVLMAIAVVVNPKTLETPLARVPAALILSGLAIEYWEKRNEQD
jgi:hypothetical protein